MLLSTDTVKAMLGAHAERLRTRLGDGVAIETAIGTLSPASQILEYTNEADLLVLGQTTNRGLWRFLLGDVTGCVIDGARCPVLVVPAGWPTELPREVVMAVAEDLPDAETLTPLREVLTEVDARLQVHHILPAHGRVHDERLEALLEGVDWCYTVESAAGDIARQLADRTDDVTQGWLCVVHRHRVPLAQLLLRCLSDRVAALTTRPVLVLVELDD